MSHASETQQTPADPGLQALARQAAGVDAQLSADSSTDGDGGAVEAEKPGVNPEDVAGLLRMGVALATPALPFLPQCYTPEACLQIGTAFAAVAEKRGWNMADVMTPELALALAAAPPTIQAIVMGRTHFAAKRAKADEPEGGADAPDRRQEGERAVSGG